MPSAHVLGICDRCGFQRPLNALRKEWTGLRVCKDCFETRHPQDFVRSRIDKQAVRDPRPPPADHFVGLNEVTADDL